MPKVMIFMTRIFNNFKTVSVDTFLKFWKLWFKKDGFGAEAYLGRSLLHFAVIVCGIAA